MKIIFDIDDVNPTMGYGILKGDGEFQYVEKLHKEFGAKFTLFMVPNWKGKNKITDFKDWVDWFKTRKHYDIQAHGLTHQCNNPDGKGQEFANIDTKEAVKKIDESIRLFKDVGVEVSGWRMPGWFINKEHYMILESRFKFLADHIIGVTPIKYGRLWRVPYLLSIDNLHSNHYRGDDVVIVHSHISGLEGNLNSWTNKNYTLVRNWLLSLQERGEKLEFLSMREYVDTLSDSLVSSNNKFIY